jgi:hypothetical protein
MTAIKAIRPRVVDPVLLVMMELAKRPEKEFDAFSRAIIQVLKSRREVHVALKKLKRAMVGAKQSLDECKRQVDWLDGLAQDGISVDDVLTCVQEFYDMPDEELRCKLLDTIDHDLLEFARGNDQYCPLCGGGNGRTSS